MQESRVGTVSRPGVGGGGVLGEGLLKIEVEDTSDSSTSIPPWLD